MGGGSDEPNLPDGRGKVKDPELRASISKQMKIIEVLARAIAGPNWDRLKDNPNSQHEYVSDAHGIMRSLASAGYQIVPRELDENMAAAMECEFSTEGQWRAALREAERL